MGTLADKFIGHGWYSIREAAIYAGIKPAKLNRWLFGDTKGEAVICPEFDRNDDKYVSFLDLIQIMSIKEIRTQRKIHPRKIRQAIELARSKGIDYPFARRHFTYLLGDDLILQFPGNELVEASGQRMFQFVEAYMLDLSFGPNGLANKFMIHESDGVQIFMDPEVRFGEPMLPSGYTARTIWDTVLIEGGIQEAANAFGIPVEEAKAAYRFFSQRVGQAA